MTPFEKKERDPLGYFVIPAWAVLLIGYALGFATAYFTLGQ